MKIDKPPVKGNVGIQVKAPTGFTVSGDTQFKSRDVGKELTAKDRTLMVLRARLNSLEVEKAELLELIDRIENDR